MRFDDAILVVAKIKTLPSHVNQEEVHAATLEGQISKKMFHQVTGHAGQQLMTDTVKYYGVQVIGVVTRCLMKALVEESIGQCLWMKPQSTNIVSF